MTEISFGVNVRGFGSGPELERLVRRIEELGYDVLAAPDHLGHPAPFSLLAAAAAWSSRLRLRTSVLNAGFWNPALLAREVATLDVLSGGRIDVGLGAGHMKSEHDDAGLPWRPLPLRSRALARTLVELRRRLARDDLEPRPVQRPIPVMIGAMSERVLSLAARQADIVGFSGLRQLAGAPPGSFRLCSAAETEARVRHVRSEAGGRPYRSEALLQAVVLGREPAQAATAIAAREPGLEGEQLLDSPFMLLARDAEQALDELLRRSRLYGFDSFSTHQPSLEALGEVIAARRARSA